MEQLIDVNSVHDKMEESDEEVGEPGAPNPMSFPPVNVQAVVSDVASVSGAL